MKNYFKTNFLLLKQALFDDVVDRTLFILTVILFVIAYVIWHQYLAGPDLFVYLRIGIYPIKLLTVMLAVNTILAVFSHDKEKEIGYFLFISNIIVLIITLILEIFYLISI